MYEPIRHPARHHVTSHPYWERLRWDDEDWYGHALTDIAETVSVLVNHSRGHELP